MEASVTLVADPMPATAGRRLGGSALAVTVCSVAAQVLAVGSQSVVAKLFGAGSAMDAYLAANTLPQYVVAVLLGALGVVFVPVFLEFDASGRADEAWTVASAVVTMTATGLILFAVAGVALAEPLLRLTTPGLSEPTLRLAARIARVTWPSMAAAGITGLLTGMYHAKGRFGWPAVIPVMGAALNLALVVVFAQAGVIAVAVAGACSVVMQTVALAWGLAGRRRLHASFRWMQPGVAHVVWLMWPLALSNIVIRYTPVVDRYLASSLPEGAISHLGYAFRLATFATSFLSVGISTVVYPILIRNIAANDVDGARRTLSLALRVMWLGVAPVIAIGIAVARPCVALLLERGAFQMSDSAAVAALWRIYLISLAGACLGAVTGRAFYALKATRVIAVMGVIESAGYAVYTAVLAHQFGAEGVAAGYVLLFTGSLVWHLPLLRWHLGRRGGWGLAASFARTGLFALLAGLGAVVAISFVQSAGAQLVFGGAVGLTVYALFLALSRGSETMWTVRAAIDATRALLPRSA